MVDRAHWDGVRQAGQPGLLSRYLCAMPNQRTAVSAAGGVRVGLCATTGMGVVLTRGI